MSDEIQKKIDLAIQEAKDSNKPVVWNLQTKAVISPRNYYKDKARYYLDGNKYSSMKDIVNDLGIVPQTVYNRIKSNKPKWKEWYRLDEKK